MGYPARKYPSALLKGYKRSILEQAKACRQEGDLAACLDRVGLDPSNLANGRRQRKQAELQALAPQERAPKSPDRS